MSDPPTPLRILPLSPRTVSAYRDAVLAALRTGLGADIEVAVYRGSLADALTFIQSAVSARKPVVWILTTGGPVERTTAARNRELGATIIVAVNDQRPPQHVPLSGEVAIEDLVEAVTDLVDGHRFPDAAAQCSVVTDETLSIREPGLVVYEINVTATVRQELTPGQTG